MKLHCLSLGWVCCVAVLSVQPMLAEETVGETEAESFRDVLELSGIDTVALSQLGKGPEYSGEDWQLLLQVFHRLQQFQDLQVSEPLARALPDVWLTPNNRSLGELFELEGYILAFEKLPLPENRDAASDTKPIYRCRFRFLESSDSSSDSRSTVTTILATRVPKSWQTKDSLKERVRVRGTLVQMLQRDSIWLPLILTNRIAWYPVDGMPTGQLLLSRNGMDVALLDEVRHKQPFVKPEISREGEAFFAALKALGQVKPQELFQMAKENVAQAAEKWQARQPELRREHLELDAELAATTSIAQRENLERKVKRAKNLRGLAATVVKQAEAGYSSVAPMFLQPEKVVGELFVFEGTARRAVRIAVEQPEGRGSYFELEVYTAESRLLDHRPVVCCVTEIPADFPIGDEIREPVRISGIFFKLWRYRSRNLAESSGETVRQRQLYTPVVLSNMPTWLNKRSPRDSRWALWGGIAFLGVLASLWIWMTFLAGRDRRARALLKRTETIDL